MALDRIPDLAERRIDLSPAEAQEYLDAFREWLIAAKVVQAAARAGHPVAQAQMRELRELVRLTSLRI